MTTEKKYVTENGFVVREVKRKDGTTDTYVYHKDDPMRYLHEGGIPNINEEKVKRDMEKLQREIEFELECSNEMNK
tara:strand:- start:301 stop:528 length:228 start_codon:yes stop_codon:yes gene_type:complete